MFRFVSIVALSCTFYSLHAQVWLDSTVQRLGKSNVQTSYYILNELFSGSVLLRIEPKTEKHDSLRQQIAKQIVARLSGVRSEVQSVAHAFAGVQFMIVGESKESYFYLHVARNLAGDDKEALAIYFGCYADVFHRLSRFDSAVYYAREMLDVATDIKDSKLEFVALEKVAGLSYGIHQYQQSGKYFKTLAQRSPNDMFLRNCYNTIGLCFRNRGIYDSARIYFDKAMTCAIKYDTLYIGLISGNIGDTYFLEGRFREAIPFLERELEYSTKKRMTKVALDCMNTLCTLYLNLGDIKNAKRYFEWLSEYVPTWDDSEVLVNYYKLASFYYQKKKNYERSFQFLNLHRNLSDSLTARRNIQRANEVSAQYDFEKNQKELNLQMDENRRKNYLLYSSFFIMVLAVALLVTLYRNYHQKKKTLALISEKHSLLEKMNEELLTSMEKIEEQNQSISNLASHLKEVNTSKDKLFSIISHDLRNPIISLKGVLKLAAADNLTPDEFKLLSNSLKQGVDHIDFTLNNMLHWARTQLQGMTVKKQPVDSHELVIENINFLSEVSKAKNIKLINDVPRKTFVHADVNQINLVIRNLISNAIKFTDENGRVNVFASERNGDVEIRISDTGIGMSEDVIKTLFRSDSHRTTYGTHGEKGSGLGLILCYEMVAKNGGSMGVESSVGVGSTFWFTLSSAEPT
jgi:signal transduction histidine kinase